MTDKIDLIRQSLGEERVLLEESLAYHTFAKVGGPAEAFITVLKQAELIEVLSMAYDLHVPYLVLGGGTKYLVPDKGVRGLVIKNNTEGIKISGIKGKVGRNGIGIEEAIVECDSGVTLKKLHDFLKSQNLQTFQSISSQYSSLGGSIFVDPYLQDVCQKLKIWDRGDVLDSSVSQLKRLNHIVLSLFFKVRAASV
jgi:UDP-N-acetylenolpyruvoylglucosamine reductase